MKTARTWKNFHSPEHPQPPPNYFVRLAARE